MPVHSFSLDSLDHGSPPNDEQARNWCEWLECGGVLYFPETPVPVPSEDINFLLGQFQARNSLHKNIAYKPAIEKLSGADAVRAESQEQLRAVMQRYSANVAEFLKGFLLPYQQRWQLDYASWRPVEEAGRDLPLHRRNDLLHTDAFPTRPTKGRRILRFFHNLHPSKAREWVVGDPFASILEGFGRRKLPLPRPDGLWKRLGKQVAGVTRLNSIAPRWKRTPYDEFMRRLHNAMKEDEEFQRTSRRERLQFAPGSSWMVYTDTVSHAVLGGQFALEQTFLVDPAAMVNPESTPLALLEKLTGARLI
jgi:hypothetical protein